MMQTLFSVLPVLLLGAAMAYFNKQIADFFRETQSTSLIRGLDNPWTFKTVGWTLVVGYPIYILLRSLIKA